MVRFLRIVLLFAGLAVSAAAGGPSACADLARAVKAAPPGAVFLSSYPSVEDGPLHATAFVYDNAVAAIALTACGKPADARRIGDALLYALASDRFWHDGRLRNAYAAGAVGPGPVKLAGWWDAKENRWVEDRYQVGADSGNLAWAVLALLTLDATAPDRRYRTGATTIAGWLLTQKAAQGGFSGGAFGYEPHPQHLSWVSTEHNVDLAAAFGRLARATGDPRWRLAAGEAAAFVAAMNQAQGYAAGTDGKTVNRLLALDAQVWPALALSSARSPQAARSFDRAPQAALAKLAAGAGYAYDESRGGLWCEGTAQVALLRTLQGRQAEAKRLLAALAGLHTGQGYRAAGAGGAGTGLGLETDPTQARRYFPIPHLGATAWVALAETGFNPFLGTRHLP